MKRAIALFAKFPGKEQHDRLFELAELVQRATNRVWWLWGQECGKANKDILAHEQWHDHKAGRKNDTKLFAVDPGFQSRASQDLAGLYESLHSRVSTLLVNETVKRIKQSKSTIGKLPLWKACLLNLQNMASANYRHPIPFDRQNASLTQKEQKEGPPKLTLTLRLDRFFVEGSKKAKSDPIVLELIDRKANRNASRRSLKATSYVSPLERIARGEAEFAGSEIVWQAKQRRWKVVIVVDVPDVPTVPDNNRILIVRPGVDRCWETEIPGENPIYLRCSPDRIAYLRKSLRRAKEARNNQEGSSARVGRGRKRRLRPVMHLTGTWERITRTMTQQIAAEIARKAIQRGCSKVRYEPPQEAVALDTAGDFDSCQVFPWPWFATKDIFEREFTDSGLTFVSASEFSSGHKGTKGKRAKKLADSQLEEVTK